MSYTPCPVARLVEEVKRDPVEFARLREKTIVVHIMPPGTYDDPQRVKSTYTLFWGEDVEECGKSRLDQEGLEQRMVRDSREVAAEGVRVWVNEPPRRMHSFRLLH